MTAATAAPEARARRTEIIDAVLAVLARDGIGGVTMRAVARVAGVSVGLASYYFADKTSLVCAALRRIGEHDLDIVGGDGDGEGEPVERLRRALRRIGDDEFVDRDYLSSRLQLWSLAAVDGDYAEINRVAHIRYLDALTGLLAAAMPELGPDEVARRAGEILVLQNGIWLTAAIIDDREARDRSIDRCERIAFAPAGTPDEP